MEHSFNTDIAKEYGIEEAIILHNLFFWINKNTANDKNFKDGSYWTYNSITGYAKLFPYIHEKKIKRVINLLVDEGLVKKGNFNENRMVHTNWYAFTEKGIEYLEKHGYKMSQTIGTICPNRKDQKGLIDCNNLGECNTDINNTDINTDNNILTDVSSTETTTNEAKPKDNENEKTASAIPEKKAKKLESSDIAAAADPASRYGKFLLWMRQDTPYCYKNLTLPTEKQFEKLLNDYGGESVKDIVEEIENRKDKRKNYSNLNLTIKNWMKYRESKKQ